MSKQIKDRYVCSQYTRKEADEIEWVPPQWLQAQVVNQQLRVSDRTSSKRPLEDVAKQFGALGERGYEV
jgi:hypothetical protein